MGTGLGAILLGARSVFNRGKAMTEREENVVSVHDYLGSKLLMGYLFGRV